MSNAFQPGAFQVGAFQVATGFTAAATLGLLAGITAASPSITVKGPASLGVTVSLGASPGRSDSATATLGINTGVLPGRRQTAAFTAFQSSAFQPSAFQEVGTYIDGSIFSTRYAVSPALAASLAETAAGVIPATGTASLGFTAGMPTGRSGLNAVGPATLGATFGLVNVSAEVQIGTFVSTAPTRLYKPPTRVVTREQPYLALVTQVDPSWSNRKFREVQYEFQNRRILFNPYVSGAYNNYGNSYPVGAQYGPLDPNLAPLVAANIGAVAQSGQQVVELPRPAGASPGTVVIIVVADGSAPQYIPASAFSDGANEYKILFSTVTRAGFTLAVAYALLAEAIPKNASISYVSPNTITGTTAITMAGLFITGAVQPTVFDPAVTAQAFGTGQTAAVTSGQPAQGGEVFIGISVAALEATFSADGLHGWTSLQQAAAGGSDPLCICTSVQSGPNFDPGSNASVLFGPGLSGIGAWSSVVLGVRGNKPGFSGVDDGKGWA